jgi:2-amino-4-hydroxy-6-hydroxymethyldihydropteridine diphosphokinase
VTIAAGVHALAALPGAHLHGVSRLYATEPVGVTEQPEFRNAVAALDVPTGPDPATGAVALLLALKGLERAFGRRERERWGPRELDLDLLVFGRNRIAVERPVEARSTDPSKPTDLVVPHRLAGERAVRPRSARRPRASARPAGLDGDRRDSADPSRADRGPGSGPSRSPGGPAMTGRRSIKPSS